MKDKKIYIAGKITGLHNYEEKFAHAENKLIAKGAITMNPAKLSKGFKNNEYMHICLAMVDVCDAIYLLDNWTGSIGATQEFNYATEKGKEIIYQISERQEEEDE